MLAGLAWTQNGGRDDENPPDDRIPTVDDLAAALDEPWMADELDGRVEDSPFGDLTVDPVDDYEGPQFVPIFDPWVARSILKGRDWDHAAQVLEYLHDGWASWTEGQRGPHPLIDVVRAYVRRPVPAEPNLRRDRILPGNMAMVAKSHRREGRLLRLFSPAAHRRGQLVMPGFGYSDADGPALPLALYHLGNPNPQHGGGRGAPLAQRLFIESILALSLADRRLNRPIVLQVTLRDLLARLYPGGRTPRPNEYWTRLMRAVEALDAMDARIPWHDPDTGKGGNRRVVSVGDIPRGPGALDDDVGIVVYLPPGSGDGPLVTPTLGEWGVKSGRAYNALLNLAYRWFDPGITRYPVRGGRHWLQSQDPGRYPALSDADVVSITQPLTTRAARRKAAADGWGTLRALESAGELRIDGRRVLPPSVPNESPDDQ